MAANGYLSLSSLTQVDGWAYLETNTAHAWVAACNEMVALGHGQMTISAPDGAYRPYAQQVYWKAYWTARGMPNNAADAGTSNHGLGTCVDIWEVIKWPYAELAPVMERHGFVHDYAPEPWHWHHTSINPADNTAIAAISIIPIGEEEVKLRFITAGTNSPWYVTNGLTKRALAPGENQILVDLGLAVYEINGGGVKQVGQAAIDRIPNVPA